ncbi:3-dehydroquinate synthase, partial [Acinetobacter baumannii]
TQDPKGRLEALYAERDPLYREVADFVIETGKPSVAQLANMVLMQLEMSGWIAAAVGGTEAHPDTDTDADVDADAE